MAKRSFNEMLTFCHFATLLFLFPICCAVIFYSAGVESRAPGVNVVVISDSILLANFFSKLLPKYWQK
jgi:hypothetical protein